MCELKDKAKTTEYFQKQLNKLLEEKNMSKNKFADFCDIGSTSMQLYLNGDRMPGSYELAKICQACSVSADWLLGLSNYRTLSADLRSAVMYTGLTEDMIERIRECYTRKQVEALTDLVEDEMFPDMLDDYSFYLAMLEKTQDLDILQSDTVDKIEITDKNKVVMNITTAKALMISRVSNDIAEICNHKAFIRDMDIIDKSNIPDE